MKIVYYNTQTCFISTQTETAALLPYEYSNVHLEPCTGQTDRHELLFYEVELYATVMLHHNRGVGGGGGKHISYLCATSCFALFQS